MEEISVKEQIVYLLRQRNFFAGCMGLVILANFLLAFKLFSISEKVIMVPGINRELIIDGTVVSKSYLEETAMLYSSALLDLTADTIKFKKNIILKHVSDRSEENIKMLQEYFDIKEQDHKKLELSTAFTPRKIRVDNKKLEVIVEGLLTSIFGRKGFEQEAVKYLLSFDYVMGHLKLKEFKQIKTQSLKNTHKERKNSEK